MTVETIRFEPRGVPSPAALGGARVQLHWAAQVLAAVARALIRAARDDSHTSLEWLEGPRALAGGVTPRQLRLALRPSDLTLVVMDADGSGRRELPLPGRTLDEALAWAADQLGGAATGLPSYEMPEHAVGSGGVFRGDDLAGCAELARWYATADRLLRAGDFLQPLAGVLAAPVRCWPHHFDIATLVTLSQAATGGVPTIGVGLSPGDGSYAQPYFYVTPWPYPQNPTLPPLPPGATWHQTGWFGAVLTGAAVCSNVDEDPSTRAARISEFLRVAVRASAALLGQLTG